MIMKKFYILEVSDKSAAEFPRNYNWRSKHSVSALNDFIRNQKEFPDFTPKLSQEIYDDPEFNKINDFIFGPIDKYCVSKRVKELFEQFNLPKHRFFPVEIFVPRKLFGIIRTKRKINAEYFAFYFDFFYLSNNEHWIDYDRTKYKKNNLGLNETEHIFLNKNFDIWKN